MQFPQIDPIALQIGPIAIHWYGLMYLLGFAAAWFLLRRRAQRVGFVWTHNDIDDVLFYGALGVVLGGRVGYMLFYNFDRLLADPLSLFRVWEGGMSFHGGLLGVLLAFTWFARKTKRSFFDVADWIAPVVPVGLAAGRIGNFINGELWGRVTDGPWGVVFPQDPEALLRHPSQLYQAVLEGLGLFLLLWWFSAKPRPAMSVSGLFLLGYGCARILVEFVRVPDAHIGYVAFGWLTQGQILSLPMIVLGVVLMALAYKPSLIKTGAV